MSHSHKFAKDLVTGDIFIDPQREGLRPAKVENVKLGTKWDDESPAVYTELSDWTGLSNWGASYDPLDQLVIVTEQEAIEQTQRNRDEHAQRRFELTGIAPEQTETERQAFITSLNCNKI